MKPVSATQNKYTRHGIQEETKSNEIQEIERHRKWMRGKRTIKEADKLRKARI